MTDDRAVVAALSRLDVPGRTEAFRRCCASEAWVAGMNAAWPFETDAALEAQGGAVWWALSEDDWLEAFAAHAQGGTDPMPTHEQPSSEDSSRETIAAFREGRGEYETRFGYPFLICATGLDTDRALGALRRRITNDPSVELHMAAAEFVRIVQLRTGELAGGAGAGGAG